MNSCAHSVGMHRLAPQSVDAPLTAAAIFLVVNVAPSKSALTSVRSVLAGIGDLTKNVAFRDPGSNMACTVGIGSDVWDHLVGNHAPRPIELHPFQTVQGPTHTAVSTPCDLLFHIRAERRDLCFKLERQLLDALGSSVTTVDETVGFRYFDNRDLLGFVDGTANPTGPSIHESTLVTLDEDCTPLTGGSYVVVQKYTHDLEAWQALKTEEKEAIVGRTKLDNMELGDATGTHCQRSHKMLNTIVDDNGDGELDILRDNMPFGSPATGEFGTYFIGYTRRLWVLEKMLQNMFNGNPPGLHDRLLDYSKAQTGTVFFVSPTTLLAGLDD